MNEALRELLYPLGFISSLAFTARFLIQWMESEKKKQSVVTPLFWYLSLFGNCSLWIHSVIQLQLHVALIQACNGVISWRNLQIIGKPSKESRLAFVFSLFVSGVVLTFAIFALQAWWTGSEVFEGWFRIPAWYGKVSKDSIFWGWHLAGFGGLLLFNSRFWVQWWLAEKHQASSLNPSFWWMSLVGDVLCLIYFTILGDPVNLLGPVFGLVPYIRNLMLIYKQPKSRPSEI